jgi:hypothetical protein
MKYAETLAIAKTAPAQLGTDTQRFRLLDMRASPARKADGYTRLAPVCGSGGICLHVETNAESETTDVGPRRR